MLIDLSFIDTDKITFCERLMVLNLDLNAEQISRNFFINQSWQLTQAGYNILKANFISYQVKLDSQKTTINGRILLNINDCLYGPWHVRAGVLTTWDRISHFDLTMVDGDLERYIKFKAERVR